MLHDQCDRVVRIQNEVQSRMSIACTEGYFNRDVAACLLREFRIELKKSGIYFTMAARQSIKSFHIITRQMKRKKQGA